MTGNELRRLRAGIKLAFRAQTVMPADPQPPLFPDVNRQSLTAVKTRRDWFFVLWHLFLTRSAS
ncbi:MAG: hypothetical protein ACOX5W_11120 [Bacillota bacterium]